MSDGLLSDADLGIGKTEFLSDADLGIGVPTGAGREAPSTYGERQAVSDEAKIKAAEGIVPEGVKAGAYSAANTALLNVPSHIVAAYTAKKEKRPYAEVYKEQKEYEDALARRNPYASGVGTAAGFVGGLAVPLGPVATLGRGAGALASKAGPLAAKAAESATIGGTLSGAGSYIEKGEADKALRDAAVGVGVGAVAGPAISGIASRLAKKPPVVDASGDLTPQATAAVEQAFGRRLDPADIDALKPFLQDIMGAKGISPAAAKEALLKSQGISPTASMVTGKAAPEGAAKAAEEANIAAKQKITETGESMAGPRPPESAVAKELYATERSYNDMAKAQYDKTFSHPGHFTEDFADLVMPQVQKELNSRNLPTDYARLPQYTYAPQAMALLREVSAGNMPLNQPINMRNLDQVNKGLNTLWGKSSGEDRIAIQSMKNGFLNSINEGVQNNLFYGNGAQVIADMQKSRDLWSIYKKTFYGKDPANQVFRRAFEKFKEPDGSMTKFPDAAAAESAQAVINANLLKGNMGAQVYSKLEGALGKDSPGMDAVNRYIKNNAFEVGDDLKNFSKNMDKFLSPESISLAKKVFTPAEISQMRRMSEAVRIINARKIPDAEKEGLIVKTLKRVAPAVLGGIVGSVHGIPGSILASLAGESIGAGARGLSKSMQIKAQQAGAPIVRPEVNVPVPVRNISGLYPTETETDYRLPPDRTGRASGGRIGSEAKAEQLIAAAERAKNNLGKETKSILNTPDEHIARALEIANKHI
jgi:hypothetical protein